MVQLSHPYMTTGKTIALTIQTFVSKVMSLLLNMLFKLVIDFHVYISFVQLLSRVRLFVTPWTTARQASLFIINTQSLLKLTYIELVMPSNHPSSVVPFSSYLQSFPTTGSFQMSQFFASAGQSIGVSASASVLPMNTQN